MSYVDAREVPSGSELETDVCIIGAGAAGITIASELIGSGRRVLLLESGGRTLDAETQALFEGENIGEPYYPLATTRLRLFGGTTNHWSGACRPLDAVDFTRRDWVPRSGWPVEAGELADHYRRAHAVCDIEPAEYDPAYWVADDAQPLPLDAAKLHTVMYLISPPTRFGEKFAPALEGAANVATYLNGNAVSVETDESGARIRAIEVACLTGTRFRIRAGAFILATGSIENARFLLHCLETDALRLDAASQYWVGRCFMEHLTITGGVFLPSDPSWSPALYRARPSTAGQLGYAVVAPSPAVMSRERILHAKVHFVPTTVPEGLRSIAPGLVGAAVAARAGRLLDELGEHVRNVVSEVDEIAIYSYERMFRSRTARGAYYLSYHLENAPEPDSRITLGDAIDRLGMRQVRLRWAFGELERHTVWRMNELVAAEAGAAGLGRVWDAPTDSGTGLPPGMRGAWHQMGTTRMSADPVDGVVDGNCKVHGLENFYVTGGSVFTTSGHANPTLTVVALALRLADHIKAVR